MHTLRIIGHQRLPGHTIVTLALPRTAEWWVEGDTQAYVTGDTATVRLYPTGATITLNASHAGDEYPVLWETFTAPYTLGEVIMLSEALERECGPVTITDEFTSITAE